MDTLGIDVSEYQARTPPLKGLSFLIARATIGNRADLRYPRHIAAAKRAGIVTGAYHFNDRRVSPTGQARAFLATAGEVDFYFLDVEGAGVAMSPAQAQTFMAEVRRTTGHCGIYHSRSGFFGAGQDYDWVALYDSNGVPPSRHWDFWQYRGSPLDLDRFHGTPDELRAFARQVKGDTMQQTYDVTPDAVSGTLTVPKAGHGYQRLLDGSVHTITIGPPWVDRQAYGPVKLHTPIPGGAAGADRQTAYIVGVEAAAVLASDCVFIPDHADGFAAAKAKAIAAVQAIQP